MSVGVVVPAYNAERLLADALRSIFRNACVPLEVVVVDDGSTDRTLEVASAFPVRLVHIAHGGVAAARNAGWSLVESEHLAWLDADDLWPDGRLERQLRILTGDPAIDVVYGRVQERQLHQDGTEGPLGPARVGHLPGCMLIRRKSFASVGGFDETLSVGEFMDWLVRSRAHQLREAMLDDTCLVRRIHGQNLGIVGRDHRRDYLRVAQRSLKARRGAP